MKQVKDAYKYYILMKSGTFNSIGFRRWYMTYWSNIMSFDFVHRLIVDDARST